MIFTKNWFEKQLFGRNYYEKVVSPKFYSREIQKLTNCNRILE